VSTALIIVDLQKAIDDPSWGTRNHPDAEANVLALLTAWRKAGQPVIHVRHSSREPDSTYRPGQAGFEFKDGTGPLPGELVITKQVNSAFIGTDLEQELRSRDTDSLVFCGVTTNNSVEATVRNAGNLGFETYLAEDATAAFDLTDLRGRHWTAADVHAISLANLHGEYATVTTTEAAIERLTRMESR